MSYCINPSCPNRQNPDDLQYCQACDTELLINKRYRLVQPLREIYKSPYVEVFEVDDRRDKSKVLKILKDNDDTLTRLFEQEAQVLIWLRHPGIPKVEPDGYFTVSPNSSTRELHCLVMEKVAGEDLQHWLKQNGLIPDQNLVLEWLRQLAEILHQVHQNGLFHRDIKPSNIMLRPNGQLALIDFGAARRVTQTVIRGREITGIYSYGYTAPEQVEGRAVPQSDFFALGRTFVHLLTGQHPADFAKDSQTGQLLWRDNALQVSQPLADFIDQLIAPSWEKRPQDTREILRCTEQIILQITWQRLKEINAFQQLPFEAQEQSESSDAKIPTLAEAEPHPGLVLYSEQHTRLKEILMEFVGPIAPTLLQKALVRGLSFKELVEHLTLYLSPHQRTEFERQIVLLLQESTAQPQMPESSHQEQEKFANSPSKKNQGIDESFIHQCERSLTDLVGPIATFLVQKALQASPQASPTELVETLVGVIPDPQKASEFQQRLLP